MQAVSVNGEITQVEKNAYFYWCGTNVKEMHSLYSLNIRPHISFVLRLNGDYKGFFLLIWTTNRRQICSWCACVLLVIRFLRKRIEIFDSEIRCVALCYMKFESFRIGLLRGKLHERLTQLWLIPFFNFFPLSFSSLNLDTSIVANRSFGQITNRMTNSVDPDETTFTVFKGTCFGL